MMLFHRVGENDPTDRTHPLGLTLVAFAPTFFATGSISWYSIHTVL